MFASIPAVSNGLMPVTIGKREGYYDRELTIRFINSLEKHWKGSSPFSLLVIVPDEEILEISDFLPKTQAVSISVTGESTILGTSADLVAGFDWWRRQQTIKLMAAASLEVDGLFIFNNDLICIGDFDELTFVQDDKIISEWEPKSLQGWWSSVCSLLDTPLGELNTYGLSVVPNIIVPHVLRAGLAMLQARFGDLPTLLNLSSRIVPGQNVVWTDMSLYTVLGELTDTIWDYHLPPEGCFNLPTKIRSRYSVWSEDQLESNLLTHDAASPDAHFICVHSALKIEPGRVEGLLEL